MPNKPEAVLPHGIDIDDLRYVRIISGEPSRFEERADEYGWRTKIEEGIDGNRHKVRYQMSRIAPEEFGDDTLEEMRADLGIIDENKNHTTGYYLGLDAVRVLKDQAGQASVPIGFEKRILTFEFEGFPTNQDLDVMKKLLPYFYKGEDFEWAEPYNQESPAKRNIDNFFTMPEHELYETRFSRARAWIGKLISKKSGIEPPEQYP